MIHHIFGHTLPVVVFSCEWCKLQMRWWVEWRALWPRSWWCWCWCSRGYVTLLLFYEQSPWHHCLNVSLDHVLTHVHVFCKVASQDGWTNDKCPKGDHLPPPTIYQERLNTEFFGTNLVHQYKVGIERFTINQLVKVSSCLIDNAKMYVEVFFKIDTLCFELSHSIESDFQMTSLKWNVTIILYDSYKKILYHIWQEPEAM